MLYWGLPLVSTYCGLISLHTSKIRQILYIYNTMCDNLPISIVILQDNQWISIIQKETN